MVASPSQDASASADDAIVPLSPEEKREVDAARGVSYHLLKGIKMIGMYRHNHSKYQDYLAKTHAALSQFLDEFGTLQLKVDITNFQLHKHDLFNDETQLPYKFFKDGIRQLIFHRGFTLEELTTFTLIALSDPDRGAEDLNAQLWRAQMEHFEYIMVENFRMDEFSEEEIQVEVDKVVDYLQRRLRTSSEDFLRFARVSEEDLDMKLEDVEQMRGLVIAGRTADAAMKARLQKEIHDEESQRLFPKLMSAVFQVVESGVDDAGLLSDMFTQLLDAMLLQEDFAIINQVVLKLKAMEQRQGADSAVGQLLRNFLSRMSEEQRISRVGEILRYSRLKSPQDVSRYLAHLGGEAAPGLLDVLEVIELPENRTLLCELLVPHAKATPDLFVPRLHSEKPQVVRDMVYILDRANHPEKLKHFATVLKTKNVAIKLEVLTIIAKGRTGEARKLVASMLDDEHHLVRIQAARALPGFDRDQAFADLIKLVKDPKFDKRDREEREAMIAALGSTGLPAVFSHFEQQLATKPGLFNRDKVKEEKMLAVVGLASLGTIQSAQRLQEIIEDKAQPSEVVQHARMHLARVRKVLVGAAAKES
jgi:hypothetical protein